MKFLSFSYNDETSVGVLKNNGTEVVPIKDLGFNSKDMNDFLDTITDEKLVTLNSKEDTKGIPLSDIKIHAPIIKPKHDVTCLGINYYAHAEESAKFHSDAFYKEKTTPIYFSKRVLEAVGDCDYIDGHWDIVTELDYEVELGVIIGKDAKNVTKENVEDYIFGYTILNDVSARNLQIAHNQWYFGKSVDGFTSIGPYIVTKDEFKAPLSLDIKCYVNNELRQNSNTSLMITSIADAICELSKGMTLDVGTIIAMGTPEGVGMGFDPPKFLKVGDEVCCEIEGIGSLTNKIK